MSTKTEIVNPCIKMFWSIVSNAFCKSIRTIPIRRPETNALVTCHGSMTNKFMLTEIFENLIAICIGHCYLVESSKFDHG